jgi:hypothetical protein
MKGQTYDHVQVAREKTVLKDNIHLECRSFVLVRDDYVTVQRVKKRKK